MFLFVMFCCSMYCICAQLATRVSPGQAAVRTVGHRSARPTCVSLPLPHSFPLSLIVIVNSNVNSINSSIIITIIAKISVY